MNANWRIYGLPDPTPEYLFCKPRKYRFDYAWIDHKLAVEQEGGIWIKGFSGRGGAHSLPSNIIRDMEKNNIAVKLGWRVLRFTPAEVKKGVAAVWVRELLGIQ